mmetsp:Transcript_60431/g.107701  ORF Transcript_60431/g.107701 Transcript_60431/m.107701 type:complete len:260 (-) Transcript_60431:151-930(-)
MTSANFCMPRVCMLGAITGALLLAGVAFIGVSDTYFNKGFARTVQDRRLYEYETSSSGSPTDSSSSESGSNSKPRWYTPIIFCGYGSEMMAYIIHGMFALCFASMYKINVVDKCPEMHQQQPTGKDDFKDGLCDCWMRGNLPCMLIFCPFIRQAHTTETAGIFPFWYTFFLYVFSVGCCCQLCLTVFFRMQLKNHMGIRDHCLNDWCVSWACWWCVIGQMALNVDDLMEYEVEYPLTVKFFNEDPYSKPMYAQEATFWD